MSIWLSQLSFSSIWSPRHLCVFVRDSFTTTSCSVFLLRLWIDTKGYLSRKQSSRQDGQSISVTLHKPDLHSAQHHRAVHWMVVVHQLRSFWEGFRQHPPRKSMVHTQGIWNSTTDCPCHQEFQFTTTSSAEWQSANPVSHKDVLCRCCSSPWQLTGWCGKHQTDHRASDGPSSQQLRIWILPMT